MAVSVAMFLLIAVQATTAIVSDVPGARLADRVGRKPFVIATFVAFAAFPVSLSPSWWAACARSASRPARR
jgi:MFS family permease